MIQWILPSRQPPPASNQLNLFESLQAVAVLLSQSNISADDCLILELGANPKLLSGVKYHQAPFTNLGWSLVVVVKISKHEPHETYTNVLVRLSAPPTHIIDSWLHLDFIFNNIVSLVPCEYNSL